MAGGAWLDRSGTRLPHSMPGPGEAPLTAAAGTRAWRGGEGGQAVGGLTPAVAASVRSFPVELTVKALIKLRQFEPTGLASAPFEFMAAIFGLARPKSIRPADMLSVRPERYEGRTGTPGDVTGCRFWSGSALSLGRIGGQAVRADGGYRCENRARGLLTKVNACSSMDGRERSARGEQCLTSLDDPCG